MRPKRKRASTPDYQESEPDDSEIEPDDLETEPDDLETEPDDLETGPDAVETDTDAVEPTPEDVETSSGSVEKQPDAGESLPEAVVSAMTAKQFPDRNLREQLAIRYELLSHYEAGNGPTIAAKTINDIFGKQTITQATCSRWFKRFRGGNTNLVGASTRIWSQNESEANEVFRKLETEAQELREQVLKAYAAKKKTVKVAKKKSGSAAKKKKT
ncbi:hypothetical protein Ddc_17672 [Ditylenchus destructor]|nr:hypothetical protein Ddc_17672 [Ditylenchus destructor]